MVPWSERPTLAIDLDRPLSQQFIDFPDEAVQASRRLLQSMQSMTPRSLRLLAYLLELRTWGRFHAEAREIARRSQADWRDILLANISYDLILSQFGCSTVALPTPEGPVVARNMDWWPEDLLARASYLLRYHRAGRLVYANAGWPGAIGLVTGLSARGFAVVLNAVPCEEGMATTGYPVLLYLRRVVEEAVSFDAALEMLKSQRLMSPALFTLVGAANHQRVVIERSPTRHALRWAVGDEPLVTTNDYRLLFQPKTQAGSEIYLTTCHRYEALCRFFARHRPDRDVADAELLYILSDPQVIQGITAQHVVIRPRLGSIRLFVPRKLVDGEP